MDPLEFAIFELISFCFIVAFERGVYRATGGQVQNFEEDGPSWSRIIYKFWMALHFLGLIFLALIGKLYERIRPGKTIAWPRIWMTFAIHVSNWAVLMTLAPVLRI